MPNDQALALRPRQFQQLRRICTRCRGPFDDDHICHDRVRHPGAERFLATLAALHRRPGTEQLSDVLAAWAEAPDGYALGELPQSPEEIDLCVEVFGIALQWSNLPRSEQCVANAILEHAGYPTLEVA